MVLGRAEFSRNRKRNRNLRNRNLRNRNRNRPFLLNCADAKKNLFAEEPPEPKTRTARTVPPRTVTEPNRTEAFLPLWGDTKGAGLLKGGFDKACALTCRFLCRSLFHPPTLPTPVPFSMIQVGMNGDTFSMKAPKECSEKFVATFKGKILTRGNVLRIFLLFLEDFGAPLCKRCRHSSYSDLFSTAKPPGHQ